MNNKIKKDFDSILAAGQTAQLHLNADHAECVLPTFLAGEQRIDYHAGNSQPTTTVLGISSPLSFNLQNVMTFVPWGAVYMLKSESCSFVYRKPGDAPVEPKQSVKAVPLNACKIKTGRKIDISAANVCVRALRDVSRAINSKGFGTPMSAEFLQELKLLNSNVARELRAAKPPKGTAS